MPLLELIGDSARGEDYAAVRLVVEDGVIVEADAPGLERPLIGLSLLEAAAVPGETLAADALANAIAPVFAAAPAPGRIAVAMSGGVDSAVALLRAAPNAIGVTLRLWLDPAGPSSERACCSPDAVIAARETCHRLGLPARHARPPRGVPRHRRAAVRRGLRAGPDPESVHALQRALPVRRARRLRRARRRRRALDGPLRADRRARRAAADRPRRRPGQGPVLHARDGRSGAARPGRLPARRPGQAQRRATRLPLPASPLPSAPRARRRASSPATTTARSSSGRGSPDVPARSSTRTASSSAATTASGGIHPDSAAGSGSPPRSRSTPSEPTRRRTRSRSAPAARSRCAR